MLKARHILLVIGGGIAAYKALELIRELRRAGAAVTPVLTAGGQQFITPLSAAALAEQRAYTDLFDLTAEAEMGHIQLSRSADLLLVCPATADLLAKMAAGIADDLATTILLATDKPVMAAPAMNVRMWEHAATRANVATLRQRGVTVLEPDIGPMACGEVGPGRLPEVAAIVAAAIAATPLSDSPLASHSLASHPLAGHPLAGHPLAGRHAIVTAGPTHERIDPVRYIANRSSGRQGFAIAEALRHLGAEVTLVAGPVSLPTPAGVRRIDVESARQMDAAVTQALPADLAVMVAAVADWGVEAAASKIKKGAGGPPELRLRENPDILANLSRASNRPALVVGFAAETNDVIDHGRAKLARKGCDLIVANDVSGDVMGGANNLVHLISAEGIETLAEGPKEMVARELAARFAARLTGVQP